MGLILNGFGLIVLSGSSIILSVGSKVVCEQLINTFKVCRTGWGLGLGINGNLGQVQIQEGDSDLTEAVIDAINKGTT